MNTNRSAAAPSPLAASRWLLTLAAATAAAAAQDAGGPGGAAPPANLGAAFRQALTQMRADKTPGLVFVLPPADAVADRAAAAKARQELVRGKFGGGEEPGVEIRTARELLLAQLQLLRASSSPEVAALRLLTVQVVAERATAGSKAGETLVLLAPTGERTGGFNVDLGDHAAVLAALTPAVLAPAAVEPRRANVPPEVGKLAARHAELLRLITERQQRGETLDAEQCQELQEAQQALTARLGAAAPALVELTGSRAALAPGRIGHFSMPFDQQVPFGTAVDQQWDPCPPCGMMAVPLAMRSTLKLLAQ